MAEPLVTVALQFFNCRRTLATAIRSVRLQTLAEWELLLHDDGSTDGSGEIAASFADPRVTLIAGSTRRGRPACINDAIGAARGRYFALADGDDVAYPERLERQVAFLERHPEVDLLGTPLLVFGAGGRALGKRAAPQAHADICRRPWSGIPLWQPTFVGRLEWFREHRYDPRRRRAQDQELLVRTCATSRFANLPEILAGYREETISLAKSWRGRLQGAIGFAAEYLRRRRPDLAALAFGLAAAKGLVDTFAVASGLGYRVLRHRARPLAADELAQWREVWRMLGEEECDAR